MTTIELDPTGEVDIDSLDPDMVADIRKFERVLARYLAGEIEEDVFKVFRLANGVYGQRQGGHNQMVRIKAPTAPSSPHQLERLADVSERYSRGWGHLTTRQNVQFHYVELEEVPVGAVGPGRGRPHHPRGLLGHRPQRHGLPPRRRLPPRGARHPAVGRGHVPALPAQPDLRRGSPASSRSTSRAASPTAARPCSTTSA